MNLTLCDWEIILAAYAYEYLDRPIMSDNSYDAMCAAAGVRDTAIPGFLEYTGQWISEFVKDETRATGTLKDVLEYAWAQNKKGQDDLHQPAVQAALDYFGIKYTCCGSMTDFICWEEQ